MTTDQRIELERMLEDFADGKLDNDEAIDRIAEILELEDYE